MSAAGAHGTSHAHTGTGTAATILGLTNGTAYQVRVRANSAVGDSEWSDANPLSAKGSETAVPAIQKPDAPQTPTVAAWTQELRVSWIAPADNGASITDYDVRYCTDSTGCDAANEWTELDDAGNNATDTTTSTTLTGLTNGTTYQVQVRAGNSVGDSDWSTSAEADPAAQKPDQPDAPTVAVWNASLRLSWNEPDDNDATITDYDVQYRTCTATPKSCTTSPAWTDWTDRSDETSTDTTRSATIGSLTNGTAYEIQVRAANSVGESEWSTAAQGIPAAQKPDAPAAPTLTAKNDSLDVSWIAPGDNGSAITDYDVQYRACTATDSDTNVLTCATNPTWGSWTEWNSSNTSTATTAAITGLTNGTKYQVQLQAANSVGDSVWSASASAAPAPEPPNAPAAPTVSVWNAELRVSWTAPNDNGAAITDYDVQYRACTATDNDTTNLACDGTTNTWATTWSPHTHSGTARSAAVTGLTNNTAYQVQVRAANSAGTGPWSASTSKTPTAQAPGEPGAPSLTARHTSLAVSWTAPASNGASITDYDVQHRACTATDNDTTNLACDGTTNTWSGWTALSGSDDPGSATSATISSLTTRHRLPSPSTRHQQRRHRRLVCFRQEHSRGPGASDARCAHAHGAAREPRCVLDSAERQRRRHHRL